jgi:soluble lytic murein transglycosylase-like protein
MKKYKTVDRYRLYEGVLCLLLIIAILFLTGFTNKNYKNVNNGVITKEQQEFIKEWNGIPNELREWLNEYEEEFQYLDIPLSKELQIYTFQMSKKYEMDYLLILSIMQTESNFKTDAKSVNNTDNYSSLGLMQLNQRYENEFIELTGKQNFNIYNSYDNILGGIAKLKNIRERLIKEGFTSEDELWYGLLNIYNLGYTKYKNQVINRGMIFTRGYDQKVLENKLKLEEIYYK